MPLVVKNGSKMRPRVLFVHPDPCVRDAEEHKGANADIAGISEPDSPLAGCVEIVSVPPVGMASRAFTAMLMTTCSSWPGSARTQVGPAAAQITSSTSSPMTRRSMFRDRPQARRGPAPWVEAFASG